MSEWISVEDRLPERGDHLTYHPPQASWDSGFGVYTYFGSSKWGTGHSDAITHWMPLPDPPK